jgi:hypothetical protein
MTEKRYLITGTFEVIFEDEDKENAVMQTMDNYLASLTDEYDECFKSVTFEFDDVKELKQ